MPVVIPALDLTLLAVHVPNRSEMWKKQEFLDATEAFAVETTAQRALIVGDLNNALPEDFQGNITIPESIYLQRLLDWGWVDAWRLLNPGVYEYTWFSHRQNGFRLDHCFASPLLAPKVVAATLRHDVRTSGLSDHSALTVSLDL
jgi:exonuclease III